ncbi:hypothetical protein V1504DRAFT_398883 [Lipomyces starkeyi]
MLHRIRIGLTIIPGLPLYREHIHDLAPLKSIPTDVIRWSLLSLRVMKPRSSEFTVRLNAIRATTPPHCKNFWVNRIPVLGPLIAVALNAGQYTTRLEDNAELIAGFDLEEEPAHVGASYIGNYGLCQEQDAILG